MSFEQTSYPDYSQFIYLSRYSKWQEHLQRRETWDETVYQRWLRFWKDELTRQGKLTPKIEDTLAELADAIYRQDVMPSMRSLMTAGIALERDHVAAYNCSYAAATGRGKALQIYTQEMEDLGFDEPIVIKLKNPISFDEFLYILLCGTGVGYSVERQYIVNLPTVGQKLDRSIYRRTNKNYPGVPKNELSYFNRKSNTIQVADSKYGWASALRILIVECYNGNFGIKWDVSKVRPAGEKLKTFGGRSSGPDPLVELFQFVVSLFSSTGKRKLTSLEVHSIITKIASIVVVGGVRRSALLGLSNLSDDRMRHAKSGNWYIANPHFALANNSACYTEKPDAETFIREFGALIESKSGERGFFNRQASQKQAARNGRRDYTWDFGTNPLNLAA
ncbi:MAG: hypothetical protein H3Z50_07690 [archaeon]|nr:hypothetical protein [archaeon]